MISGLKTLRYDIDRRTGSGELDACPKWFELTGLADSWAMVGRRENTIRMLIWLGIYLNEPCR